MASPAPSETLERLVSVIQELSLARDLATVMDVVRHAARALTGADGATFVLRDGDLCYYAEEDAIAPLWKGKRFPMDACISGWAMLNRQSAVIPDVYADPRVPVEAYRPTFVKSLAMVPIRTASPIGAIGNYWARPHRPTDAEVRMLQALADSASIALENVQVYAELESRIRQRTAELEGLNQELESFSYSVSHDLRAPLRAIDGFSRIVQEDFAAVLPAEGQEHLGRVRRATQHMARLIEDLLRLARVGRSEVRRADVDLAALAAVVVDELRRQEPARPIAFTCQGPIPAHADPGLLRIVLENLLGNAWKFTRAVPEPAVELGVRSGDGETIYFVRDNGAGFDMAAAGRLFTPFQRLHAPAAFPGTGVGLATVQRIVRRHGGRIWAEAEAGAGATFFWTLAPRA